MIQNVLSARIPEAIVPAPRTDAASAPATAATASTAAVAGVQRDVTGSLSVVTKDGDTVTLSASYDAAVTYGSARQGAGGFSIANAQASRSVSIEVKGNLNPQEMRDIRQVVKRFMHDLREMVRGGQPSIDNVTAVHSHTLASISATTDTTNTVTVAAISARPLPVPAPVVPVGGDTPQDSPALRAPLAGEDAPDAPASPAPALLATGLDTTGPTLPAILLTRNDTPVRA